MAAAALNTKPASIELLYDFLWEGELLLFYKHRLFVRLFSLFFCHFIYTLLSQVDDSLLLKQS